MIFIIFLLGILVLLGGLLPLLKTYNIFSTSIFPEGQLYYLILVLIGLILTWYGLKKSPPTKFKL